MREKLRSELAVWSEMLREWWFPTILMYIIGLGIMFIMFGIHGLF